MSIESLKRRLHVIAVELGRFARLLFGATIMGGLIGGLAACISFGIREGEPYFGLHIGVQYGAIMGFLFYFAAHWFVFKMPPERVAKFLIGGTLIGSLPLALIPVYGAAYPLCGGTLGYWLGLEVLLFRVWREKRVARQREEKEDRAGGFSA